MSIIYEALKRLEKAPQASKSPQKNRKIILFVILSAVFIVFIVLPRKNAKYSSPSSRINKKKIVHRSSRAARKRYPSGRYVLEGVIYDGQVPRAVINGRLLKQNDKIDNYELIAINSEQAELFDSSSQTKLILEF